VHNRHTWAFGAVALVSLCLGGCAFSNLNKDLARLEAASFAFEGTVTTHNLRSGSLIVVAMNDVDGSDIAGFSMLYGAGEFEMLLSPRRTYFLAFNDLNKDLAFQINEPFAWAADGNAVGTQTRDIRIAITSESDSTLPVPRQLVGQPLIESYNDRLSFALGTVTPLTDAHFSDEQAKKGLWEPFSFMADGGTGIHMLSQYDPDKVPVLFVHGILDSPRNFAPLIGSLDQSRYQAWVYSYPSGLKLGWLSRGLAKFLEAMHADLEYDALHVVAHSMGGLVARGMINYCVANSTCAYLQSFTAISTPWDGVDSARAGVKWAPTVVPVWRDIVPDSQFVESLFDTALPENLPFHLLFGYRQTSVFGAQSSDGVIKLASQLRRSAQEQADLVRGYDQNHVDILSDEHLIDQVQSILDGVTVRGDGG